mmetsp:Transcript_3625/g.5306  ORF Transcript_3625/g.5306 Transcript_3625/m.5306 type:complete len:214 (+) Transcript_3625:829-1470(+)
MSNAVRLTSLAPKVKIVMSLRISDRMVRGKVEGNLPCRVVRYDQVRPHQVLPDRHESDGLHLGLHLGLFPVLLAWLYEPLLDVVVDGGDLLVLTEVNAGTVRLVELPRLQILKRHVHDEWPKFAVGHLFLLRKKGGAHAVEEDARKGLISVHSKARGVRLGQSPTLDESRDPSEELWPAPRTQRTRLSCRARRRSGCAGFSPLACLQACTCQK